MNYMDFFESLSGETANNYIFAGEEEFVKETALDKLIAKVLGENYNDFNLQIIEENEEIDRVIENVKTYPFMCENKLVVWKNSKLLKGELSNGIKSDLQELFGANTDGVVFVLYIKGKVDKRRKSFEFLKSLSTFVEFNTVGRSDACKWINNFFKKEGKTIEQEYVNMIVASAGTDILSVKNEVEKILQLTGDKPQVEREDLKLLPGDYLSDLDAFNVLSLFIGGDKKTAMEALEIFLGKKKSEGITGALGYKLRRYYYYKAAKEKGVNPKEITAALGKGGYYVGKEADMFSKEQIERGIRALEYADYALKNGIMDMKTANEYAVTKFYLE